MTIVPLFGVVGATAAFSRGLAILSWAVAHHRRRREHSIAYEALFDPIPVIALVCIVFGARLIVDPPASAEQLRPLVSRRGRRGGHRFRDRERGKSAGMVPGCVAWN